MHIDESNALEEHQQRQTMYFGADTSDMNISHKKTNQNSIENPNFMS